MIFVLDEKGVCGGMKSRISGMVKREVCLGGNLRMSVLDEKGVC